MPFTKFQRMLSRAYGAVTMDKHDFEMWNNHRISTEECIRCFCKNNNHIGEEFTIDPEMFERWLESIGYLKNKKAREERSNRGWESSF